MGNENGYTVSVDFNTQIMWLLLKRSENQKRNESLEQVVMQAVQH